MPEYNPLEIIASMMNGAIIRTHFPFKLEIFDYPDLGNTIVKITLNDIVKPTLNISLEWYPTLADARRQDVKYPDWTGKSVLLMAEGSEMYRGDFEVVRNSKAVSTIENVAPGEYTLKFQ